jgi:hypothetical protein
MEAFAGRMECLSSLRWKLFSFHTVCASVVEGKKLSSQFAIHPCERCFSATPNSHSAVRVCIFRLVLSHLLARRRKELPIGRLAAVIGMESAGECKVASTSFFYLYFLLTEKRFECSLGFYICLSPRCTRRVCEQVSERSSLDSSWMLHEMFANGSYTESAPFSGTWQQT